MWAAILSFIGGPIVKGIIDGYKAKLAAGNTTDKIAAELAERELDVQAREVQAHSALKIAEVGHPWEVEKLFGYVTLVFYAKCLIWDKMLGRGTTPGLTGDVSDWAGVIIAFYFGKRGIENVARIVGNRFGK